MAIKWAKQFPDGSIIVTGDDGLSSRMDPEYRGPKKKEALRWIEKNPNAKRPGGRVDRDKISPATREDIRSGDMEKFMQAVGDVLLGRDQE